MEVDPNELIHVCFLEKSVAYQAALFYFLKW